MIISILKRALSVSLLFSISYHASAQDVWFNLFYTNGEFSKINANRVDKVQFQRVAIPENISVVTYTDAKVDLSGKHFVSYNPFVNSTEGFYKSDENEPVQTATFFGGKVFQFYKNGGLNVYDADSREKLSTECKKLTCASGVEFFNVSMTPIMTYTTASASESSLTMPLVFASCKVGDTKFFKMFDVVNDREVYSAPYVSDDNHIPGGYSGNTIWTVNNDDENGCFVLTTYPATIGSTLELGAATTLDIPYDDSKGVNGDVLDASAYKSQLLILVKSKDGITRLVVFNKDYKKVTNVVESTEFSNPFAFVIDKSNRRVIALGKDDDGEAEWNEVFVDRTQDLTPSNQASTTMYVKMKMKEGDVFQTQVRYLTHFTITEGTQLVNSNIKSYSGQQLDFDDSHKMYYYHDAAKDIPDNLFRGSRGADAIKGTLYRFYMKTETEHAKAQVFNLYSGEKLMDDGYTLSVLDGFDIRSVNFSELTTYNNGGKVAVAYIPLAIVSGFDESGQCMVKLIDITNDRLVKDYIWTGHTKSNTPGFVCAMDFNAGRVYFVGKMIEGYAVQGGSISQGMLTLDAEAKIVPFGSKPGLTGELVDCTYANGVIYALVNDKENGKIKIFGADPILWAIKNILVYDGTDAVSPIAGKEKAVMTGTPVTLISDPSNQQLIINTETESGGVITGNWWNVVFE